MCVVGAKEVEAGQFYNTQQIITCPCQLFLNKRNIYLEILPKLFLSNIQSLVCAQARWR